MFDPEQDWYDQAYDNMRDAQRDAYYDWCEERGYDPADPEREHEYARRA